jgi:hypothetical protein
MLCKEANGCKEVKQLASLFRGFLGKVERSFFKKDRKEGLEEFLVLA